ncbi:hypothetical protein MIND_01056200 [Mycena indigotica]|uniref:Mini-chromosome maintenance complex-binding protein n=1 Tax=Mycena indigotica TaxID=2126181 RepID=A0A8H6S985_9AGAR|nr:uncharacterized protein MIND_01056200 [Mycena indigotica]KAF7295174.1 hypothetical protein MIND_01056200 [Mycena indigotica]
MTRDASEMVNADFIDAIADISRELEDLYDAKPDFPSRVWSHFSSIFASKDAFSEIPSIHAINPIHTDRKLVKGRFMIQDTSPSPEMYLAHRSEGKCGGWGLADDIPNSGGEILEETRLDLRENVVVWAVQIPHESDWVGTEIDGPNSKFKFLVLCNSRLTLPIATHFTEPHVPETHPHKFPTRARHLGVQVKIYDTIRGESLKSTEIYTLVGIYTMEQMTGELDAPGPILVPTLHVLFFQPLTTTLVPRTFPYYTDLSKSEALREELIAWISKESLGGDKHVAEWVLLATIARVQSRSPPLLPPSLTISKFPSPSGEFKTPKLLAVLSQLFPMVDALPLSLDTINHSSFSPESKNEDLHSGRLQLPRGSICVVTEGGVTEGGIVERGVMNIRALQVAMTSQTLDYVFPFSRFSFETDIAFLVLAEGRKSTFFQTHSTVPLQHDTSSNLYGPAESINLPSLQKLALFRQLVGGAKIGNVTVEQAVAEHIQEDFVSERKATSATAETVTSEDLIHRMTVARLIAMSMHQTTISLDVWKRVKWLEAARKARLDVIGEPKTS